MKKLLLALTLATGAASLHGMEAQKQLSPISLAQTYHQFLHSDPALPQDVTQQIFSFYFKAHLIELAQKIEKSCRHPGVLIKCIETLIKSCGYELASELCKQHFSHVKISICDIQDHIGWTALHYTAYIDDIKIVKLLLDTAGDKVQDLMDIRAKNGTAFDIAKPKAKEVMQTYLKKNQ